jgi:hypothetical protein
VRLTRVLCDVCGVSSGSRSTASSRYDHIDTLSIYTSIFVDMKPLLFPL